MRWLASNNYKWQIVCDHHKHYLNARRWICFLSIMAWWMNVTRPGLHRAVTIRRTGRVAAVMKSLSVTLQRRLAPIKRGRLYMQMSPREKGECPFWDCTAKSISVNAGVWWGCADCEGQSKWFASFPHASLRAHPPTQCCLFWTSISHLSDSRLYPDSICPTR